ncbi:MAG: glycosyltransferase [Arthrobacter sp.]|uniref:glycosyltransferase n=1 Tax=Arthrobacter sp. TaxID=1667 RepID=UPI0034986C85
MSKGKRISVLGTRGYPSYYGGFETAVRKLAPAFADAGWDVTVYSRPGALRADDPGRDPRIRSIETHGLETKQLSTLTYGLTSALHAALVRRPDVALVMNVANGFWLPLLKLARIPTVVNVDGIEWEREKWGRLAKLMFLAGAHCTAWFADYLVADSREIQRRWRADFGRGSTFIAYGGDIPDPGTTAGPAAAGTSVVPLPGGARPRAYALFVARMVPENSVDAFMEAARVIGRSFPVILIGGAGYQDPVEDRLRSLAASEPAVTWLGHLSDDVRLHALWSQAGVYFHGHSVGGTNPALVQAMACAAPIVARDTVYNREVLGDAALFVEPDPQAVADACLRVLWSADLRSRLGSLALARSRRHYQWSDIAAAYVELATTARRRRARRPAREEIAAPERGGRGAEADAR